MESGVSPGPYHLLESSFPPLAPRVEKDFSDLVDSSFTASLEVMLLYALAVDLEDGLCRLVAVSSFSDWMSVAVLRMFHQDSSHFQEDLLSLVQSWNQANVNTLQLLAWATSVVTLAWRDAFLQSVSQDLSFDPQL